jgi:CRISPR-associated endonuclease/helicase Cas3
VIDEIDRRLTNDEECRVVSTQVVEAGVDLDFPTVFRAMGPLDGIVQAAGRCNREGRLRRGRVVVFRPTDGGLPAGAYRIGAQTTESVLKAGTIDPDDPAVITTYFQRYLGLLGDLGTDRNDVQKLRAELRYPDVAKAFRMIDDDTESIAITAYGTLDEQRRATGLLGVLRRDPGRGRVVLRELQPYLVSVRRREAEEFTRQGLISPVQPGIGEWLGEYDPVRGIVAEAVGLDRLVV